MATYEESLLVAFIENLAKTQKLDSFWDLDKRTMEYINKTWLPYSVSHSSVVRMCEDKPYGIFTNT